MSGSIKIGEWEVRREVKNVQFEKCRVSHKLHKNNGNTSKKYRKYT
jgi:hypothetical protein